MVSTADRKCRRQRVDLERSHRAPQSIDPKVLDDENPRYDDGENQCQCGFPGGDGISPVYDLVWSGDMPPKCASAGQKGPGGDVGRDGDVSMASSNLALPIQPALAILA